MAVVVGVGGVVVMTRQLVEDDEIYQKRTSRTQNNTPNSQLGADEEDLEEVNSSSVPRKEIFEDDITNKPETLDNLVNQLDTSYTNENDVK